MQLVPEKVDGAVVFNVVSACSGTSNECGQCTDFAVAIHNWLVQTDLKYVIFDLQDEKNVCPAFLEEIIQLWKRMRFPFLFSGVMSRPRAILESFGYEAIYPIFNTPEEAVKLLQTKSPASLVGDTSTISFGEPIQITRPRFGGRGLEGEEGAEEGVEVDEVDDVEASDDDEDE